MFDAWILRPLPPEREDARRVEGEDRQVAEPRGRDQHRHEKNTMKCAAATTRRKAVRSERT